MASSAGWWEQRARLAGGGGDPGKGTLPHLLSTVLGACCPKHLRARGFIPFRMRRNSCCEDFISVGEGGGASLEGRPWGDAGSPEQLSRSGRTGGRDRGAVPSPPDAPGSSHPAAPAPTPPRERRETRDAGQKP